MNSFITRENDYAIRICAYLAGNYDSGPIPLSEISRKLFITRAFAHKIVHRLKRNKIIATVQGKHGGIYLKKHPEKLSIYDILTAMGFNSTMNECVVKPQICPLVAGCKIHLFFMELEEYLLKQLKERKIIDFSITDEVLSLG